MIALQDVDGFLDEQVKTSTFIKAFLFVCFC